MWKCQCLVWDVFVFSDKLLYGKCLDEKGKNVFGVKWIYTLKVTRLAVAANGTPGLFSQLLSH